MSAADLEHVVKALEDGGEVPAGTAARVAQSLRDAAAATPWYVHVLLAVAAWLGVLILLVTLFMLDLVDSAEGAAVTGLVVTGVALALRRASDTPFAVQLSLALSLTGMALLAGGAAGRYEEVGAGMALCGLGTVALFAYPDPLHRLLCVLLAVFGLGLLAYAADSAAWMTALGLATAGALAGIWLLDASAAKGAWAGDWLRQCRRPVGYGLAMALAGLMAPTALFGELARHLVTPVPGMATAAISLVLVATGIFVGQRLQLRATPGVVLIAAGLTLGIGAATYQTPGVVAAALLLVLGQYREERGLLVLGCLAGAASLSAFYYQLDMTLLAKSLALTLSGVALLGLRFAVRRTHRLLQAGTHGRA